ncbi:MarC family protein [Phocaeicola dorei]|jgi:multiple antibiotic resistance protein|uniref:MarC family protein n=2 Tax=Phocaeicola dorei TaxID=357276 RepID=UPI0032EFA3AD
MLCGPSSTANGIMLMNDTNTWTIKGILIGMIALIYFITYLILRNSTRLVSILGKTVNNVIMRLMGLILMVIAVKCFVSELKPILIDIIQSSRM